mgnify:CR=1 FL=1
MQFTRGREGIGLVIGLTSLFFAFAPYGVFYIAVLILTLFLSYELCKTLSIREFYLFPALFCIMSLWLEIGLLAIFLTSFYIGWKYWNMAQFLKAFLIGFYSSLLPVYLLALKKYEPYAVVKLLLFVWSMDVLSYYVGKTYGKHALAPRLSPQKTWEGLLGGYAGGTLILVLLHGYRGLIFSLPMVFFALMGDLFKSFIKRQLGIKDFSNILGEHGGFVDRFDSTLFTAPIYLFLLKL